jgi:hypothetical protein
VPSDVGNAIGWEEKAVASDQSLPIGSIQERFLSAQANPSGKALWVNHSLGNEWEEKPLACFARNDDAAVEKKPNGKLVASGRALPSRRAATHPSGKAL